MSNICIFRGTAASILYLSYQNPLLVTTTTGTNNENRTPKYHRNEFLFFCDLFKAKRLFISYGIFP